MRRIYVLLFIVVVCIGGAIAVMSGRTSNASNPIVEVEAQPLKNDFAQSSDIVDGATNPERIPDYVAYSLFFDLIAERQTGAEQNRIRAYLRQIELGNTDINALIAVANQYSRNDRELGQQANAIRFQNHPNHFPLTFEETNQLRQLQQQHNLAVQNTIASLARRLSADGLTKIRRHINERVKRKTKMSADVETN